MNPKLAGKRALVTGAGQGIGRKTVLAFAAAGATVWATGRTAEKMAGLQSTANVRVLALDVADQQQVQTAADAIGEVDVLVNCAGIVPAGSIEDCSPEEFRRTFDINVAGAYYLMKAFIGGMARRSQGCIINIASVLSSVTSAPGRFAYGMSKAALIGMTKAMAADYAAYGVRCNALCPGTIDTPGLRERIAATPDPAATRAAMAARHPLARLGTAEEIAAACVFLA